MTRVDEEDVRRQLERLLESGHFRNSRRYPALLRYVVQQTLDGQAAGLKERTLGIEVFGRPADYDTSTDPIVRVTVAEVRKRIAQYYQETSHLQEVRIGLNPGSYVPEFSPPRFIPFEAIPEATAAEVLPLETVEGATLPGENAGPAQEAKRNWLLVAALAVAAVALLVLTAVFLRPYSRAAAMNRLWSPVFADDGPITFCLPISNQNNILGGAATTNQAIAHALDLAGPPVTGDDTFREHQKMGENVVYSDVIAMLKLDSVVAQQHRPVRVRLNVGTTLNDFREGPSIFLGGLDNQWTLRLLEPLRYRFAGSDTDEYYIRDRNAPNDKRWAVRLLDKVTVVNHDYALIARVRSDSLEHVVMLAAGIGMSGTAAAGEFLADPVQVQELERRIGYRNRNRDFEAVLETDVDDGVAGAARIVALDIR